MLSETELTGLHRRMHKYLTETDWVNVYVNLYASALNHVAQTHSITTDMIREMLDSQPKAKIALKLALNESYYCLKYNCGGNNFINDYIQKMGSFENGACLSYLKALNKSTYGVFELEYSDDVVIELKNINTEYSSFFAKTPTTTPPKPNGNFVYIGGIRVINHKNQYFCGVGLLNLSTIHSSESQAIKDVIKDGINDAISSCVEIYKSYNESNPKSFTADIDYITFMMAFTNYLNDFVMQMMAKGTCSHKKRSMH